MSSNWAQKFKGKLTIICTDIILPTKICITKAMIGFSACLFNIMFIIFFHIWKNVEIQVVLDLQQTCDLLCRLPCWLSAEANREGCKWKLCATVLMLRLIISMNWWLRAQTMIAWAWSCWDGQNSEDQS